MSLSAPCHGHLTITAIDKCGNKFIYDTPNIITYGAAIASSHCLMGETSYVATYLAVGTGNSAPARDNTTLDSEAHRESLGTPAFPTVGQVEFTVILDFDSPANGSALTEAGLVALNDTLLARQIHSSITKDANFQLEYRWRIVFT